MLTASIVSAAVCASIYLAFAGARKGLDRRDLRRLARRPKTKTDDPVRATLRLLSKL